MPSTPEHAEGDVKVLVEHSQLSFHPKDPKYLLSGSVDGLVNICDTSIADDDEVILQAFNHGSSIHHAGFVSDLEVFALSNDEKLALYTLSETAQGGAAIVDFGDMRPQIDCKYVANVLPKSNGDGAVVGAGKLESVIPSDH